MVLLLVYADTVYAAAQGDSDVEAFEGEGHKEPTFCFFLLLKTKAS